MTCSNTDISRSCWPTYLRNLWWDDHLWRGLIQSL